jgi:putative protease
MIPSKKPELLAPAGNLEKLRIAFAYGADACYIGGTVFGLRKFADNFSLSAIEHAVEIANNLGKKVYLVLNGFAHNEDIENLIPYLAKLEKIQPHGFIISDMGVMQLARKHTTIPLHTSTQASVTNLYGCQLWKNAGASRVILAREVSIKDCIAIKKELDIELEVFVHGAMCASYSGKCVISNYTAGRDSNRGGCIQSCRHTYDIMNTENNEIESTTHIMNAKDLNAIALIPQLIASGIESLKIEGRMKSNLYVANTVAAYRQAIDHGITQNTLSRVSNRTFSTGGLENIPDGTSINYTFNGYEKSSEFIGTIKEIHPEFGAIIEVKSPFQFSESLHILNQSGTSFPIQLSHVTNMSGEQITEARQNTLIRTKLPNNCHPCNILFKTTTTAE